MKKKATKKRIKLKNFILFLIIVFLISSGIWYLLSMRIRNIYVLGNTLIKEEQIIEEAGLIDYPKIKEISSKKIEEKLSANELIEDADVNISLLGKVTITIQENEILFKDSANNYYLDNGSIITNPNEDIVVPSMINEMPNNTILDKFIRKYKTIKQDIRLKISEIEYTKDDLDKEKFLFYMHDGNYVYVTLSKIELINSYNDIYGQLGGNRGILHLDSGNHFQIKNGDDNSNINLDENNE